MKRLFDIFFAAVGLCLFLPLGLLLALIIKLEDGGAIFYRQVRIGQFGKPFRIWKFRSMVAGAERLGAPVTSGGDPRVTSVGCFLRGSKLDELPQLLNVLVGEMSLVGPRPEVPKYVEMYTSSQREILLLKPGLTDLASLMFRNEESLLRGSPDPEDFYIRHCFPKKIELNRHYAASQGIVSDVHIILRTISSVASDVLNKALRCAKPVSADAEENEAGRRRVAIIGMGELASKVASDLVGDGNPGVRLAAIFDDNPFNWNKKIQNAPVVGMPECILNQEWVDGLDEVIIALPESDSQRAFALHALLKCTRLAVKFAPGTLAPENVTATT